jgi:hypothetical protein
VLTEIGGQAALPKIGQSAQKKDKRPSDWAIELRLQVDPT